MAKTVVILGGSYAGLTIAHKLLHHTLPRHKDLKVVLVSNTTHLYWNMASVRAVVPGVVKDEEIFQPIEPGFAQYPAGSAEFVLGTATGMDGKAKTVTVQAGAGDRTIAYDYLVIATGARAATPDSPWKSMGSYEEDLERLHSTSKKVAAASHIVVAGAGATGIELAGELRYEFKDKTVVLLCAGQELMNGVGPSRAAERELRALGVEVRKGCRALSSETLANGKTKVHIEGPGKGEGSIETDLYLQTTGLVPNSGFLPADLLTTGGYVDVDDQFRVKTVPESVWAIGDVVSRPRASWVDMQPQTATLVKNIESALNGKQQAVVKGMPFTAIICAVGRSRGVGVAGYLPLPSYVCYMGKGRTLGVEKLPKFADGSWWA